MAKIEITPLNISGVKVPSNLLDNLLGQSINPEHLIYPIDLASNPQYCHAVQFSIYDYQYPEIEAAYKNLSGVYAQGSAAVVGTLGKVTGMLSSQSPDITTGELVKSAVNKSKEMGNSAIEGLMNIPSYITQSFNAVTGSNMGAAANATKSIVGKAPQELDQLYQNYGGFITPSSYLNRTKTLLSSISLYMPDSLVTDVSSNYEQASLTDTFKLVGYGTNAYSDYSKYKDSYSTGPSNIAVDDAKRGMTGVLVEQANKELGGIIGNALKRVPNPQVQLLYRGLNLRSFQFDFTFTPTSQKEADQIDQIIKTFTYYSLPQLSQGINGQFFVPPQIFGIKFAFMGNDGVAGQILDVFKNSVTNLLGNQFTKMLTGSNPSKDIRGAKDAKIFQINDCVLENIQVNYAPNGWASYTDGSPIQTTISLTFKEMNLIHKDSRGVQPRVTNNPYDKALDEQNYNSFIMQQNGFPTTAKTLRSINGGDLPVGVP